MVQCVNSTATDNVIRFTILFKQYTMHQQLARKDSFRLCSDATGQVVLLIYMPKKTMTK